MKLNTHYTLLFLLLSAYSLAAQYEGDQIFDESTLHEIRITAPITLTALAQIHQDIFLSGVDSPYTQASVVIDGNELDSIGVRVKGGLSSFDPKSPLKLDFNEFVPGRAYDGLKKLNLHQGNMEESFIREALAYNILRTSGVKSSRTSFAKVYYNDDYQGIYTLIEQVDNDFIKNRFASNNGALYKTFDSGILELRYEEDNSFTFEDFKTAVQQIPDADLHIQLPNLLDVESFLRYLAVHIFINSVDGPIDVDYNYYVYYEPKSERYVYIPWDYNLAFYQGVNYPLFPTTSFNFMVNKVISNTELRERYLDIYCQQLAYNFDENRLQALIDTYANVLDGEVQNDPFLNTFENGVAFVRSTVTNRFTDLSAEMNSVYGGCEAFANPIDFPDVVINEVVASNDSLSGIFDAAGGFPDWIELYNNTNNTISLKDFYLSNDADVLKHWRFPDDTEILGNDYLIIWADRDIDEQGLHTDFKLSKTKGDLFLSFENGTIMDAVSYVNQETNIAYARVPNGTGNFVQQQATHGTNNMPTSVVNISELNNVKLFPNPANKAVTLQLNSRNFQDAIIQILDIHAHLLVEKKMTLQRGANTIALPINQLESGMYVVQILDNSKTITTPKRLVIMH